MYSYLHKVQYYETDQMRVVHHANYIRWMEEARLAYLNSAGVDYADMEQRGILSPVLSVSCQYRSMTRFGDTVRVEATLIEAGSVRYRLTYRIVDSESGTVRAEGESSHCFVSPEGRVLSLKRADAALLAKMQAELEAPR
ncbi:MAG: acyl-CoA thioesterase [Oscillospiraceae bacterium]|nr:acyl-CoA thioesterase [Oscillospiraceae bacterium]